jgi:zinc protease
VLSERVESTAFLWHNYGKSTIGSRTDIERVPVAALRAFYEKFYQPDNATLVVAGKFDEAQALANVEKRFGVLPKPTRKLPDSYTVEPVQDGERSVTLRRNGDVSVAMVAYHTVGAASPDFPAVRAALDLLDRKPSGRLYKKLVETKIATSVNAGQEAFRDPWLAEIAVETRDPKSVDKVLQTIIAETEGLATAKIDDKEVERWKTQFLKNFDLMMTNSQRFAIRLTEGIAIGDWRAIFAYRDLVKKVTAADIQRVAKTFFKQSNRTIGEFLPTKDIDRAPLETTPSIADAVKGVDGGKAVEQGETFEATLDNVESRTTRTDLKGGVKAAFLTKKTRGGKVSLTLSLHWGDDKSLSNKPLVGRTLAALMQRGTSKKSYEDIHDLEDKLKAEISIGGGNDGLNIHIQTLRDNLPAAIDLVAEMLTSPSLPEKELEIVRQQTLAALEEERQEPQQVAGVEVRAAQHPWPKSDPRHTFTAPERIAIMKNMQLGDVKSFYRDFVGASHGELVVVGDFDKSAVQAQTEKLLGSWQSKKPYTRLIDKAFEVAGVAKSIDIKDKEMATFSIGQDVAMKDTDPDYPAWVMVGQVFGGDTGSRIWMRLREKEGLSYGAWGGTYAAALDDAGGVWGAAIVAPQNLAKAKASMIDELNKMATGKTDEAELQRAKELWRKDQDRSLANDNYVVGLLAGELFEGRTNAWYKELRDKVSKVTTADVERVAKKWLHPDRLVVIDAGDHAKASAPPSAPAPEATKK